MIGVDGSEDSMRAVKKIREIEEKWPRKVVIFHAIKHKFFENIPVLSIMPTASHYPAMSSSDIERTKIEEGKTILNNAREIFGPSMAKVETRLIKDENPAEYLKKVVEEEGFDLVVLGYKGEHSKLKEFLMGSVAEKALEHASCDVLIVR